MLLLNTSYVSLVLVSYYNNVGRLLHDKYHAQSRNNRCDFSRGLMTGDFRSATFIHCYQAAAIISSQVTTGSETCMSQITPAQHFIVRGT